ncbi:MAG: helix-turn-helix transcriptional regulator [Clostridia bacterium]|nr:helix-turn-helix transcriptional regulator [Clostridia bacterium]
MEVLFRDTKINCRNLFTWQNLTRYETVSSRKVSSFYRITYIWQGYCRLYLLDPVTGEAADPILLQKGDFCYIPPGTWYYTETPEGLENTNIYFYYTTAATPPEAIPAPEREALQRDSAEMPPLCPVFQFTDIPILSGVFHLHDTFGGASGMRQILEEWNARYRYADEMLNCMTAALLLQMVRYRDFQSRPASREAADRAIQYIGEHFREKIDCRLVARELGYHPNYLNTVIRDTTGMTLHEYIIDTKIRHAIYLVTNTRMRISEIAAHLSFNDASHFTNVYTAKVGISPTGQRKRQETNTIR